MTITTNAQLAILIAQIAPLLEQVTANPVTGATTSKELIVRRVALQGSTQTPRRICVWAAI
jgi:hypothetical protein